jgi:inosine-uridine nucleoside N-ribohydrolase
MTSTIAARLAIACTLATVVSLQAHAPMSARPSGAEEPAPQQARPGAGARPRVVIDADTSNEVDDAYAIVRALLDDSLDVVGLSSAQWQSSHWATATTMEDSQRLNEVLLAHLGRGDVKHPRGAAARLYDWGQDLAQHSAAANFLIQQARAMPAGEKLTVIVLGAWTNLASALLIDPTIAPKVRAYLLGTSFDPAPGIWTKLDFNCVNDLRAVHVVFDAEGLETHVMPVSTAAGLPFGMAEVERRLAGKPEPLDFLVQRWKQHVDGARRERVIWDLALVEAFLRPELATAVDARTPPENRPRSVRVFTAIDGPAMKADFFAVTDRYVARLARQAGRP